MNSEITLSRDCEAVQIPSGHPITLPAGMEVVVTQSLGGTYTVATPGGLARIDIKDADALGLDASQAAEKIKVEGSTQDAVWSQLKTVFDPEIPVNVVDLGLIYDCSVNTADGKTSVLVKMTLTAPGCGMGPTIAADASVLVAGTLAKDTYTVKTVLPAGVAVKAFVLEVLTDPSLPKQGPGRAENANFVLSTFSGTFTEPGKDGTGTPLKFAAAQADFEQTTHGAAGAIDGDANTGWAIDPQQGKPHWVLFTIAPDVKLPPGATVTFTLDQQYSDGKHALGKFRLKAVKQ